MSRRNHMVTQKGRDNQNPFDLEDSYDTNAEDDALDDMQDRAGKFLGAFKRSQGEEYPKFRGVFKRRCGTRVQSSG